ncbi:hypothetical protein QBC42DRAFT_320167 [Cladorrhinum samala]|uniref:Cyclin-like f-box protein n=1 Tax=Cladorrhinum samala TaxID=585594 RepID=A0AAV9HC60_9PEZI|nr:hypothetical protein QBC42DRAFT_320167 [Cladorrhinum samala]
MSTTRFPFSFLSSLLLLLSLLVLFNPVDAQQRNRNGRTRNGGNRNTQQSTPQQQAASVPQGISTATDGSTILDSTVQLNGVPLRFKISAPSSQFTTLTDVPGSSAEPNSTGELGVNVLLHGDGGQSFFDFPNQAVQGNQLGVALLAPSTNLLWGQRTGPAPGLDRADGAADALLVRDFVKDVLPQLVAFDASNVFFTGVSGGALLLSGFFMPVHLSEFAAEGNTNTGVLLMCGAMPPQVGGGGDSFPAANARVHYQSTTDELQLLQGSIPDAIRAFEELALAQGLSEAEVGRLQTVDNSPQGGHCEFDGQGFVSGIQLVADDFAAIMLEGGDGEVNGIGNVLTPVVGNEALRF